MKKLNLFKTERDMFIVAENILAAIEIIENADINPIFKNFNKIENLTVDSGFVLFKDSQDSQNH